MTHKETSRRPKENRKGIRRKGKKRTFLPALFLSLFAPVTEASVLRHEQM